MNLSSCRSEDTALVGRGVEVNEWKARIAVPSGRTRERRDHGRFLRAHEGVQKPSNQARAHDHHASAGSHGRSSDVFGVEKTE